MYNEGRLGLLLLKLGVTRILSIHPLNPTLLYTSGRYPQYSLSLSVCLTRTGSTLCLPLLASCYQWSLSRGTWKVTFFYLYYWWKALMLLLIAWNTGTCLFMIWTGLACLNQFINSIVWTGNVINWAPVWCDICESFILKKFPEADSLIATRFMIGSSVAIPAASLCINRRLYYIATANAVTVTKAEKRRAVLVDLAIGLGIPVLEMVLRMFTFFLLQPS